MQNKKPNVLLIMSDSLSPHYMGAYGDVTGATPNLDNLARSGVTFDRAYCNSPLCAPSRASMVTGRYVSELGAYDNGNLFSTEIPTFNHVFKRAGYETVLIGKMHFIGYDQYHGFDKRLAMETDYSQGYNPKSYRIAYDWNQLSGGNPMGGGWMGESYVNDKKWDNYTHHYDRDVAIHKEAVRFLSEKSEKKDSPFFCCVSYHHPHNPFYIPENMKEKFKNIDLPLPQIPPDMAERYGVMEKWLNDFHYVTGRSGEIMDGENLRWLYETYLGMTADMDARAGELLEIMKSNGLDQNTIVIFTSDHGDMLGYRGMIQKRCLYERSIRVPLIFSYPGRYPAGTRINSPASLLDLLPTFADMVSERAPDNLPGSSVMNAVQNSAEAPDKVIFCEYHGEGVHAPCFAGIKGNYKYIYVHGHEELFYDLKNDPEELDNRINDHKYSGIKDVIKAALLKQFDPELIAAQARQSQENRKYIFEAYK